MVKNDKRINWKQKYSELEQKTFEDCFDDAIKLLEQDEEINELKQKVQCKAITYEEPTPISSENKENYENAFILNGDAWEIWFKGTRLKSIKTLDGLAYIANLLSKPNKVLHVTALCDSVSPQMINQAMMEEDDLKDSLHNGTIYVSTMQDDDGLADETKKKLKKQMMELKEAENDCDLPASERQKARQDLNNLMTLLNKVYGKSALTKKPPKKVSIEVKKDLDRALKSINRAYKEINKQSPELCKYLKKNIKTGTQYIFIDNDTLWHISI